MKNCFCLGNEPGTAESPADDFLFCQIENKVHDLLRDEMGTFLIEVNPVAMEFLEAFFREGVEIVENDAFRFENLRAMALYSRISALER